MRCREKSLFRKSFCVNGSNAPSHRGTAGSLELLRSRLPFESKLLLSLFKKALLKESWTFSKI